MEQHFKESYSRIYAYHSHENVILKVGRDLDPNRGCSGSFNFLTFRYSEKGGNIY